MAANKKKAPGPVPTVDDVVDESDEPLPAEVNTDPANPRVKIREAINAADEAIGDGTSESEFPKWVIMPEKLKLPTKGKKIYFMKFEPHWTDAPGKGVRHCILWSLTEEDEKIAINRAGGNNAILLGEMAKMMIRAIDGHVTMQGVQPGPGNVRQFWRDIGAACRQIIINLHVQTSTLPLEDRQSFFAGGFAVRTVA